MSHEYLIEQVQDQKLVNGVKTKLNFNHPVKELIWATTSGTVTSEKAKLTINGHDRFAKQDREYFQVRQPLDHHTAVPGFNIKESERPKMLATPIVVSSGVAASVATIATADNTFEVLAATTSNLKFFSQN